jgi:hypothetical protein
MNARTRWSRILIIAGLIAMVIGAIDPLEGSVIILLGIGLAALSAFLGKSRFRTLLYSALILAAIGVGAMFVLSMFGGIGGSSGRSMWWGLVILPYPVGWVIGLVGAIRRAIEVFKLPVQQDRK